MEQNVTQQGRKFFIKTFGCQMNEADTERMMSLLSDAGMSPAKGAEDAELIIVNGCTVRDKAVHKAISALGTYNVIRKMKESGESEVEEGVPSQAKPSSPFTKVPMIGVGGCVGQLEKDKLFKRAPYIDFVFGTDAIDQLPEIVHRVEHGHRHLVYTQFDKKNDYSTETKIYGSKSQAFVNIMKGCDKFCTYCIVPFTRGREKSRTIDEVLNDLARLVGKGIREVTLLGQNVNSFGKGNLNTKRRLPEELNSPIGKVGPRAGEENFPQLLRAIDSDPRLAELVRLRFTSSHPLDFSDELLECYAPAEKGGVRKLAQHLHLPVQSGSNRVLEKMGRHHQIETYVAQMDRLKALNPDVGLSTDLIVGFPTETEEDFQATLTLLDRVEFDNIFAFAYSPRPGTRAAKLEDDVPDEVKNERLNRLLKHQLKIAQKRYSSRVGKVMEILVEGEAKNQGMLEKELAAGEILPGMRVWTGRTSCARVVNFVTKSPRDLKGRFVPVKITAATGLSLQGNMDLDEEARS